MYSKGLQREGDDIFGTTKAVKLCFTESPILQQSKIDFTIYVLFLDVHINNVVRYVKLTAAKIASCAKVPFLKQIPTMQMLVKQFILVLAFQAMHQSAGLYMLQRRHEQVHIIQRYVTRRYLDPVERVMIADHYTHAISDNSFEHLLYVFADQ